MFTLIKQKSSSQKLLDLFSVSEKKRDVDAVLSMLNKPGLDINYSATTFGWTPLHYAVSMSDRRVFDKVMAHNPDVNSVEDSAMLTPLMLAVQAGNEYAVRELFYRGADLSNESAFGATALHYAAGVFGESAGTVGMIDTLISLGTDVNLVNKYHDTALNYAISNRNHLSVKRLLERGADPNIFNKDGKNSLMHLLGATKKNFDGSWPLKSMNVLYALISHGADVRAADKSGQSFLSLAGPSIMDLVNKQITARDALIAARSVSLQNNVHLTTGRVRRGF